MCNYFLLQRYSSTKRLGKLIEIDLKVFTSSFLTNHSVFADAPVESAFDGLVNTFWHALEADQGKILRIQQHESVIS